MNALRGLLSASAFPGPLPCHAHAAPSEPSSPAPRTQTNQIHTSKGETHMVIEHSRLPNRARILELQHALLFHTQDNRILAAHAYLCSARSGASG